MEDYQKIYDPKLERDALLLCFEELLIKNGYLISLCNEEGSVKGFADLTVKRNGKPFSIHVNIRNISNACLPYDPSVMRRQVAALDVGLLPQNKDGEVTVLLGVCEIDEKKVFAIWNAFYFVGHKTNRSCYVSANDLLKASESGLSISSYSDTPVYVATTERFAEALDKFIEVNCI